MGQYTGGEVLRVAMQLEEGGRSFYRAVATQCRDKAVADLCKKLADDEREHYDKFSEMRKALPKDAPSFQMAMEGMELVAAIIENQVLPAQSDAEALAHEGTVPQILALARKMEEDSITFFAELLPAVSQTDAAAIRKIIDEEKQHLEDLAKAGKGEA